jgi:hypothetical protein
MGVKVHRVTRVLYEITLRAADVGLTLLPFFCLLLLFLLSMH